MAKGVKKASELTKEFREAQKTEKVIETKEVVEEVKVMAKVVEEEVEPTFEEIYGIPEFQYDHDYKFVICGLDRKSVSAMASHTIMNRCLIYDPIRRRERYIRYVPTEESIFEDEQNYLDSNTGERRIGEISEYSKNVRNGILNVNNDRMLYYFMYMHGRREGSPFARKSGKTNPIFKYIDEISQAIEARKQQELELKAFALADKASHEEMLQHAYVLGVNVSQHESQVKYAYINKARENPEYFLRTFSDPKNKRKFTILKAFEQNLITDKNPPMEIRWTGSGTKVVDLPAGRAAMEYLTEWSFTDQGNEFMNQLFQMVR